MAKRSAAPIYFGCETALQILRSAPTSSITPVRGLQLAVPDRLPSRREIEGTLERLERLCSDGDDTSPITRPAHVLVGSKPYGGVSGSYKIHMHTGCTVPGSFLRVGDVACISAPELAYAQTACTLASHISLMELGFELCGTYRTVLTGQPGYQVPPVTSVDAIARFIASCPATHGANKIARVLSSIADGSASPQETKLALLLGLPMKRGGYGLGMPIMNYEVKSSDDARVIAEREHFRCDLCWPKVKLDVEYQSREMHEGEGSRTRDSRRTNALKSFGWNVVNITNKELDDMPTMDSIAGYLAKELGIRMRVRCADYRQKQIELRRQLGLLVRWEWTQERRARTSLDKSE